MRERFYSKRGDRLRLSISRKAINDFKKLGVSPDSLADKMLYFVECGVELSIEFGDIDENFYSSIENTYANAIELMDKHAILDKYQDRALKVLNQTSRIGWGFHDCLSDVYHEHYE